MRWIWIDKFLEFRSGQFARAVKNVTLAEEHLHDHYPGYPVMPASLIIEGLAQTGGILVGEVGRLRREGRPGQDPPRRVLRRGVRRRSTHLRSNPDRRSGPRGPWSRRKAFLEGELLADVEIFFAHLDNSRANQIFGPKNFVFTQQLLGVLDLAKAQATGQGCGFTRDLGAKLSVATNGQSHDGPPVIGSFLPGSRWLRFETARFGRRRRIVREPS